MVYWYFAFVPVPIRPHRSLVLSSSSSRGWLLYLFLWLIVVFISVFHFYFLYCYFTFLPVPIHPHHRPNVRLCPCRPPPVVDCRIYLVDCWLIVVFISVYFILCSNLGHQFRTEIEEGGAMNAHGQRTRTKSMVINEAHGRRAWRTGEEQGPTKSIDDWYRGKMRTHQWTSWGRPLVSLTAERRCQCHWQHQPTRMMSLVLEDGVNDRHRRSNVYHCWWLYYVLQLN